MTRTLLVDTNRAAYPAYQALCDLGHEVWVVGGKPTEPLAKLSPNYVQMDYSDTDRLAEFVEDNQFDYLVPGCNDLSYEVCAEINGGRFPGIESPENTDAINTKSEFRKVAGKIGLSVPRVLSLEEAGTVESVIIKPVNSFSGRGMSVLKAPSEQELLEAFEEACKASKTDGAIIEEFVSGQLYSHSAFICGGKVVADFIVQEDCTASPFAVDTSRVVDGFSPEIIDALRNDVHRLTSELDLIDGLVHTQFIANEDGRYWIIETTRRCPGDIYASLIEFSTGYPYAASYVAPFIGRDAFSLDSAGIRERIIRHTASPKTGESLWGFSFAEPVDIRLFVPMVTSGERLGAGPHGRAGIFFFRTSSDAEQDALYQKLLAGELYSFS
jgi:biotin carboxylase